MSNVNEASENTFLNPEPVITLPSSPNSWGVSPLGETLGSGEAEPVATPAPTSPWWSTRQALIGFSFAGGASFVLVLIASFLWLARRPVEARSEAPKDPLPHTQLVAGTPQEVCYRFNALKNYTIKAIVCTGIRRGESEVEPIVTVIAEASITPVKEWMLFGRNSVMESLVNEKLRQGNTLTHALINIPSVIQDQYVENYLFAFRKEATPLEERLLLLEDTKAADPWLKQGWAVKNIFGVNPEIAHELKTRTCFNAILLQRNPRFQQTLQPAEE